MSADANWHVGGAGKMAKPLSDDFPIWFRQDGEAEDAHAAFNKYRDMEKREVSNAKMTVAEKSQHKRWSATWSWAKRALAYDRFMSQQELETLIRYRRSMNERHRTIARTALSKAAQWLVNLDATTLKPSDAARILEVAVKIEREAAGAHLGETMDLPEQAEVSETAAESIAGLVGASPDLEASLALAVNEALKNHD